MGQACVHGVVAVIRRAGRLLAIRRAEGIPAPGAWCFPGGAMEPGESIEQAIVREIDEELGVAIRPGQVIWQWLRPDERLLLYWVLAELESVGVFRPNPAEVAEVRWVTPDEFRGLAPALPSNLLFLEHYDTCEQS